MRYSIQNNDTNVKISNFIYPCVSDVLNEVVRVDLT